eukprot:PhM_4_TR16703/c0_g1_i1/m.42259
MSVTPLSTNDRISICWRTAEDLLEHGHVLHAVRLLDGLCTIFSDSHAQQAVHTRLRLADVLLQYTTSFNEARRVLEGASSLLSHPAVDTYDRIRVLRGLAHVCLAKGQPGTSLKYYSEAIVLATRKSPQWHDALVVELGAVQLTLLTAQQGTVPASQLTLPCLKEPSGPQALPILVLSALRMILVERTPAEAVEMLWEALPDVCGQRSLCHDDVRQLSCLFRVCCFCAGVYGEEQCALPSIAAAQQTTTSGSDSSTVVWLTRTVTSALEGLLSVVSHFYLFNAVALEQSFVDSTAALESRVGHFAMLRKAHGLQLTPDHTSELLTLLSIKFTLFAHFVLVDLSMLRLQSATERLAPMTRFLEIYPQLKAHHAGDLHLLIALLAHLSGRPADAEHHLKHAQEHTNSMWPALILHCISVTPLHREDCPTPHRSGKANDMRSSRPEGAAPLITGLEDLATSVLNAVCGAVYRHDDAAEQILKVLESVRARFLGDRNALSALLLRFLAVAYAARGDDAGVEGATSSALAIATEVQDRLDCAHLYSFALVNLSVDSVEGARRREQAAMGQRLCQSEYDSEIAMAKECGGEGGNDALNKVLSWSDTAKKRHRDSF